MKLMVIIKQKKKGIKKKETVEEDCDSGTAVLMCVESVKNLKKDGNIGQRPNLDRKKCELVKKCL